MSATAPAESANAPRADFYDAVGWTVLGVAVLIGAIRMDRLEQQHINPYTIPGLLPALLGIAMTVLGTTLALRSWRRGALRDAVPLSADHREAWLRTAVVITLCCAYGIGLIGHGLPFWLASAIFVSGSILVLHRMSRDPQLHAWSARALLQALAIGLITALATDAVFERLFLVRLP
jgi:putative tricarboxylic transport membrane protein